MTEDYGDFAVTTAKSIVEEETDKLFGEIDKDLKDLMQVWTERLAARINTRMEDLGIPQELTIMCNWDAPDMPTFTFAGATGIGVTNE